jgi:hypothetical protein
MNGRQITFETKPPTNIPKKHRRCLKKRKALGRTRSGKVVIQGRKPKRFKRSGVNEMRSPASLADETPIG